MSNFVIKLGFRCRIFESNKSIRFRSICKTDHISFFILFVGLRNSFIIEKKMIIIICEELINHNYI